MQLETVATRTFPRFLIALTILMAAASPAASQLRSGTAAVRITAMVPAALSITGASVLSREVSAGHETITTRVTVRGNVSHRLEVRAVGAPASEVRIGRGQWAPVPQDHGIGVSQTDMIGDTSHLVVCRTAVRVDAASIGDSGCALTFAITSTDPMYPAQSAPMRATR